MQLRPSSDQRENPPRSKKEKWTSRVCLWIQGSVYYTTYHREKMQFISRNPCRINPLPAGCTLTVSSLKHSNPVLQPWGEEGIRTPWGMMPRITPVTPPPPPTQTVSPCFFLPSSSSISPPSPAPRRLSISSLTPPRLALLRPVLCGKKPTFLYFAQTPAQPGPAQPRGPFSSHTKNLPPPPPPPRGGRREPARAGGERSTWGGHIRAEAWEDEL